MTTNTLPWTKYTDARPTTAGPYEWRMPSVVLKDALVIVAAHMRMRMRGAGYEDVLSPVFDYWDGYRVHVPAGLEWRPRAAQANLDRHEVGVIGIEDHEHCACIYCGSVPRLRGIQHAGGGYVVGGAPHKLNEWWLECCAWAKTPSFNDPREIERVRLAAFARAAQTHQAAAAPAGAPA